MLHVLVHECRNMKLLSDKQRQRDVARTLKARLKNGTNQKPTISCANEKEDKKAWQELNRWIETESQNGLKVSSCKKSGGRKRKNYIEITLPARMDFYANYDTTVQTLTAIRKFTDLFSHFGRRGIPSKAKKIGTVCFDKLERISTSAALVLTAEISKWDTSVLKKLTPQVDGWSDDIYSQFSQLGFFDLFQNKPDKKVAQTKNQDFQFVRYIKGCCGNVQDTKEKREKLKQEVRGLVGSTVPKWVILHSGISEAVTNVTHHAYPDNSKCQDKSWYLTGSFDQRTKELKIAFYDQGIGIPKSLPESGIWEKVVAYFAKLSIDKGEQLRHATLIKAAVSIDRTSTDKNDRGKGLQDLIEFIREIGSGYLSIISYKGLFKCTIEKGQEKVKSDSFERPLRGTLIIWSVVLDESTQR